jgi:hypothetical protein
MDTQWLEGLRQYWINRYDWRKAETRLNRYPQYMARVDGFDIQFYYVKGEGDSSPAARAYARLARLDPGISERHRATHRAIETRCRGRRRVHVVSSVFAGLRLFVDAGKTDPSDHDGEALAQADHCPPSRRPTVRRVLCTSPANFCYTPDRHYRNRASRRRCLPFNSLVPEPHFCRRFGHQDQQILFMLHL